jgi:hypothetical protein
MKNRKKRDLFTGIFLLKNILGVLLLLFCRSREVFAQVYFNDTVCILPTIENYDVNSQKCFSLINITSHNNMGTDFFLYIPPQSGPPIYSNINACILFAPKRIGIQYDTFSVSADYYYPSCGNGSMEIGPFNIYAEGISDSVIFLRRFWIHAPYPEMEDYFSHTTDVYYGWNKDSNRYLSPRWLPIEVANNVEDSTRFDFTFSIDSIAHLYPIVVFPGDSMSLPNSIKLGPKIPRKCGMVYLYSDGKGFPRDTIFKAKLQAVLSNNSTLDSMQINYNLYFYAKPTAAVDVSPWNKFEVMQIYSIVGTQEISISSSFFRQSQSASLQLFDALGRPQPLSISELQIPAGESSQKIDVGNIPSGWYMLRVKMKDWVINKSFMMVR